MKIAVTGTRGFPGVQGGVENHCEKLYSHLAKMGCDITVFTRKPYMDTNIKAYHGVSLIHIDCIRNKFLEAFAHTFKAVLKARGLGPDILHIHAIGPSLFTPLARILGMRVVVTNHGPDYERRKWPWSAKIFLKFCEWAGMTFANGVIAIAENIADDIKRKFRRNAVVLPNGVEVPQSAVTDKVLKRFDLSTKKYVLAVGRFVPEKGFHNLIEAFSRLKADATAVEMKEWKLVIAGEADHEDAYSRELKMMAKKNRCVILTGFLVGEPLHELYSHAGIFVLSSYYEGLPIVLLEAMSYGLSCIASDIPANRNIELHKDRFFKTGNVELLAEKIRAFINKPWEEKDRDKQISMLADKYDWGKIAEKTLEVYRRVI